MLEKLASTKSNMKKLDWKPGNMLYPLPAVMVSVGDEGTDNIITVAWTGTINSDPPLLYISVRKSRYSHSILMRKKEFVVNLTTEALVKATDFCGVRSGKNLDKWKETGLTRGESKVVDCPYIVESPVNIECKVIEVRELGTHDMFVGEVVNVKVDETYLDERGRFRLDEARPIAYSHGEYFSIGKKLGSFGYSVKRKKKKNRKRKLGG